MAQLYFDFVGTCSECLELDPSEFVGQTVAEVVDTLWGTLHSISPGVSFFHDDVVLAANAVVAAGE